MRVLIIENSRVSSLLLKKLLGQQGFDSDQCSSIESARNHVDAQFYELICINHQLEDGYGNEFVSYCRQQGVNKETPILYLVSDSDTPEELGPLPLVKFIFKLSTEKVTHEVIQFIQTNLDPIFSEGRILFVEDSKVAAVYILSQLENTGYKVDHYRNAESAWSSFKNETAFGSDTNSFDLVITDITLEGTMNGQALASKIRAIGDARGHIPIIALTGTASNEVRLSLYESGVSDFIPKPVMPRELLARINNLITNKRLLDKVHDQRRELYTLATTDRLTGCHNRHSLMDFSPKLISLASRQNHTICMLVIDLDHFKSINDNHGHAVGDVVLEELGAMLRSQFREGDLVARFGGEEFVVIMNQCNKGQALEKAEQLRVSIAELKPHDLNITASIGLTARDPSEKCSFDTLFSAADKAVYQAKKNGRNCVVFQSHHENQDKIPTE